MTGEGNFSGCGKSHASHHRRYVSRCDCVGERMITIEVVVRSVLTVTATLIAALIIGQLGLERSKASSTAVKTMPAPCRVANSLIR